MQRRSISQHRNMSTMVTLLERYTNSENSVCSSKHLGLIQSDLLELLILSYSKYKSVIIFLGNYSFYYNITFLHKKSEAVEAIKSIF